MKNGRGRGFTMIEMVIVVAVVGVLAAIALPMYNESVRKSRRSQVKSNLQEIQQNMERWFTMRNTYVGFSLGTAYGVSPPSSTGNKVFYNIRFRDPPTATTYELIASPANGQSGDRCGSYTINQAGQKTASQSDCW